MRPEVVTSHDGAVSSRVSRSVPFPASRQHAGAPARSQTCPRRRAGVVAVIRLRAATEAYALHPDEKLHIITMKFNKIRNITIQNSVGNRIKVTDLTPVRTTHRVKPESPFRLPLPDRYLGYPALKVPRTGLSCFGQRSSALVSIDCIEDNPKVGPRSQLRVVF